ncbi:MAG: HlyC/CorC family transporter [Proteobacteria bacterium]|nr:HlyC/CorC family transporter [Pseudomonadota bacterium]
MVILLLLMNGFFVAAEFALVRVRVSQLEVLKEQGNKAAIRVLKIVHQIDSYLSAVQLGVTIASLGIGALAEPAINRWFMALLDWMQLPIAPDISHTISYVIAFSLASFAHIVCGELAPKSIAIAKPLEVSMFVSMPMRIFHAVFSPIMYLLVATSNLLLKLIHIEPVQGDHSSGVSAEELRNIAHHSQDDGTITKEQGSLIENVFQFSALSAREIMIPRGKIDAIAIDTPIDEFLNTALALGHSRYPVYRTDVDDIAGIIHIKDVFAARQANKDATLESLMREVVYIPETATIGHVLEKLQQKRSHLAVVVDEYGGTSGILTLEDALERLVGDIEDEFDPEQQNDIEPQDGGWTVRGETLLSELCETLDTKEIDAESDTVSGFIMEQLGRVAKPHDTVEYQDLKYEVTSMERLRISRVFIKKVQ